MTAMTTQGTNNRACEMITMGVGKRTNVEGMYPCIPAEAVMNSHMDKPHALCITITEFYYVLIETWFRFTYLMHDDLASNCVTHPSFINP